MQIVFFCPPVVLLNGGIKYIFRMADTLIDHGYDVVVFEEQARRPTWFASKAPVVGQGVFQRTEDQIFVLPEDQKKILEIFHDWPQKKVVYAQNHFYAAMSVGSQQTYADYGVTDILCSSQTIDEAMRKRHPNVRSFCVPCSVDRQIFKPAPKLRAIMYMPRKRTVEAIYLRDQFRYFHPEYKDWDWIEVKNKSETEVAHLMGEAAAFLSLSRLEGLGLTPLEAMASGCIVTGFTGIGGREYATEKNGFWAQEDDFPEALQQLRQALDLAGEATDSPARQGYAKAAEETLQAYSTDVFEKGCLEAWQAIFEGVTP